MEGGIKDFLRAGQHTPVYIRGDLESLLGRKGMVEHAGIAKETESVNSGMNGDFSRCIHQRTGIFTVGGRGRMVMSMVPAVASVMILHHHAERKEMDQEGRA